jgi:hypothetical protein
VYDHAYLCLCVLCLCAAREILCMCDRVYVSVGVCVPVLNIITNAHKLT